MASKSKRGWWLIQLSFLVALYLQALPMPSFLLYVRPDWLILVLIYWSLNLPQRVGSGHGFVWGLLLDLIEGTLLGHNAIVMSLVAFLCNIFYQRILMYSPLKQIAMVFLFLGVSQLIFQWLQGAFGMASSLSYLLIPTLVSAFLWYWIFLLLQHFRRRFVSN